MVIPQAEHARLSALIALHWELPPPLPFASFVAGVALHDRGYGELDDDAIGEVSTDRWLHIQRAGFAPRGEDAVVDLVVAMHVQRLVSGTDDPRREAVAAEMAAALPAIRAAAGVSAEDAAAADRVTHQCDLVSFDFCEQPGAMTLAPWPLCVAELRDVVRGFRRDGYPHTLEPVVLEFALRPERA